MATRVYRRERIAWSRGAACMYWVNRGPGFEVGTRVQSGGRSPREWAGRGDMYMREGIA